MWATYLGEGNKSASSPEERTLDFATWHASAGEWRLKVCSKLKCSDSGGPWPKKGVVSRERGVSEAQGGQSDMPRA